MGSEEWDSPEMNARGHALLEALPNLSVALQALDASIFSEERKWGR